MSDPHRLDLVRSEVTGVVWPPITASQNAPLILLAERLERSQWFAPAVLRAGQFRQLAQLVQYATRHSPQFARRLKDAGMSAADAATPEGLGALPPLTRAMLQGDPATIDCAVQPPDHLPLHRNVSSGSTGEPVSVRRTAVNAVFWGAQTLRWQFWSDAPVGGRLAVVRAGVRDPGLLSDWGSPAALLYQTGPALTIDVTTDYDTIAAQLCAFDPHALIIYPTVLATLFDRRDAGKLALPSLKSVMLLGETVSESIRERADGIVAVNSCYSTMELGYLALECPLSGLHHIMSETAIVEVLGTDDQPVAEGEIGRVVATDLHNLATPLIRYDTGDWAEIGPVCPCGRGLPTLRRIYGRTRNLMTLPDGRTRWGLTGSIRYRRDTPLRQMQLIQHSRTELEARYTADAPFGLEDSAALVAAVKKTTDPAFAVRLTYVERRLDNPQTGKFEEFVSRIP